NSISIARGELPLYLLRVCSLQTASLFILRQRLGEAGVRGFGTLGLRDHSVLQGAELARLDGAARLRRRDRRTVAEHGRHQRRSQRPDIVALIPEEPWCDRNARILARDLELDLGLRGRILEELAADIEPVEKGSALSLRVLRDGRRSLQLTIVQLHSVYRGKGQ